LRGVAVLLVVLRHVFRSDVFGELWFHHINLGRMGVQLFFVISGFVIGALLTDRSSDLRTLTRFMARRMVRLSPPYFAAIALVIALYEIFRRLNPVGVYLEPRADLLLCSLAYVCYPLGLPLYLNVGWSLEIEVQFYLLACCIVPLALARGPRTTWLTAVCLVAIAPLAPEVTALRHATPFALGMAIVAYRRGVLGLPTFALISVALGAYAGAMLTEAETGAILALGALAIALQVRMPAALVWVGGISYSLYLVHVPIGASFVGAVKRGGLPMGGLWPWLWAGLAIAASIGAAWLLHRFVEAPATRWSRRIAVGAPAGGRSTG
jgi:peptidoglycan/LPS O-acetylase OafA/YrhL